MVMVGADPGELAAVGRSFVDAATSLRSHAGALSRGLTETSWAGPDAARHRSAWAGSLQPQLHSSGDFVERLGRALLAHADEQRRASTASSPVGPSGVLGGFGGLGSGAVPAASRHDSALTVSAAGVTAGSTAFAGWFDDLRDWLDELLSGGESSPNSTPSTPPIAGRNPVDFPAPVDGRTAIAAAMDGLADEGRIARDEIEIRALANGRYVVVLPGVTDLSDGFEQLADRLREQPTDVVGAGGDAYGHWADNDEPTVRKMKYAYEAARHDDRTVNEYSVVALTAMERAGVPAGAEVMVIGHSFGAYTAMDLAADPAVNAAHGAAPAGYHLSITHVVAAGAETDWRFDEVPADTHALVINNRVDAVYRAEDLLHRDGDAVHPGHLEHHFWGGWRGAGHDESHYIDRVRSDDDGDLSAWFDDVGERYAAPGRRVSVQVPDPNL